MCCHAHTQHVACRFKVDFGIYRYESPDAFDASSYRKDGRKLAWLKKAGGWLMDDPKDSSKAYYRGFYFIAGGQRSRGQRAHAQQLAWLLTRSSNVPGAAIGLVCMPLWPVHGRGRLADMRE